MNRNHIMGAVEFRDDRLQQAIDNATLAACDAETEARNAVTTPEILEELALMSERDSVVFKNAFLYEDRVHYLAMRALLDAAFERAVAAHLGKH